MTRPRAPWQHPALAPVYAAVIAFAVVLLVHTAGAVSPAEVTVTVAVTPPATTHPATTTVCLRPPADWHLAAPKPPVTPSSRPPDQDAADQDATTQDVGRPAAADAQSCVPVVGTTQAPFRLRPGRS